MDRAASIGCPIMVWALDDPSGQGIGLRCISPVPLLRFRLVDAVPIRSGRIGAKSGDALCAISAVREPITSDSR